VDLDPQTNATFSCVDIVEWEQHAAKNGTVADLLDAKRNTSAEGATRNLASVIRKAVFPNVDLIPSHLDLFTIDLDLASATARESKLRRALQPILGDYDIVICDCPPNLTIPTQNDLAMSSHYLVPVSPDYLSGIGIGLLLQRVEQLSGELELDIKPVGIVITRIGRPAIHREESVAALRSRFKDLVLKNEIKERVSVSESAAKHIPIFDSGDSAAAGEFGAVYREVLKRMGLGK